MTQSGINVKAASATDDNATATGVKDESARDS